jgi:hypothetical protein
MKFIMLSARFWDNTRLLVMLWRMSPGADGHIKNAMNWANGLDQEAGIAWRRSIIKCKRGRSIVELPVVDDNAAGAWTSGSAPAPFIYVCFAAGLRRDRKNL